MKDFDYLANLLEFIFSDKILLVDYESRTEFNLLNQKRLDVFLVPFAKKLVSACKFIHKAGCIDDTDHVVQLSVPYQLKFLGNRHWFAYAGSLNHYVIILSACNDFFNVLCKRTLQRTADASVGKRYDVARIGDFCTVGNQFCIDIHFTDVVYDYGNLVSLLIAQNLIQKCRLSCSKIPAQKCHRRYFFGHIRTSLKIH